MFSFFIISLFIFVISLSLIIIFKNKFSKYEKIWFISTMFLSCLFSILFKEVDVNGIKGYIITLLYLLDTFFNILCELLISKQSRYNFVVSIFVEIIEIALCFVLMYRFSTLLVTLLFWLPIDIISFVSWSRYKDKDNDDITIVKCLKGYQEVLIVLGIIIWTLIVGYIISNINIHTDFIDNKTIGTIIIYLDACVSAAGVCNGIFILLRLKEQWFAWYICSIMELVINILSGQYVLIVLKIAYLVNTTYGYIKWSKYIKEH